MFLSSSTRMCPPVIQIILPIQLFRGMQLKAPAKVFLFHYACIQDVEQAPSLIIAEPQDTGVNRICLVSLSV